MKLRDFLDHLLHPKNIQGKTDTIAITIPDGLYYKQMALYTATSMIANAIGKCEIETFTDGKKVKGEDYYMLNIAANPNETSTQFWHKVVEKMIHTGEALVVESQERLYCADSFFKTEYPIAGNVYENVTVGNFTFSRKFTSRETMIFRMDNEELHKIVTNINDEYGKILRSAADAFKRSNARKYKLHIESVKAGDKEFETEFENVIKGQLKDYMKNDNAVYPEFDGYELKPEENQPVRASTDFISLRKDMFEMIGSALKIPSSIMLGNITNMTEIVNTFLTFCIDPIADMISETLNKHAGYDNWLKGNYYKVKTSDIWHRDIFQLADKVDKLISSGFATIDEVREEAGWDETGEDWAKEFVMTKNYSRAQDILKGGETGNDEGKTD